MTLRLQKNEQIFFGVGLALCLATALWNIGFIGIDEYAEGIAIAIPAQNQVAWDQIGGHGLHPPAQKYLLSFLAKTAYWVGIQSPSGQLRWILSWLAIFGFSITTLVAHRIFSESRRPEEAKVSLLLLSLYFLSPLIFSRLMAESIAIPFVALSMLYACRYWQVGMSRNIAAALAWLAVGSMFRFQLGVCAGGLLVLMFLRRDRRAALAFLGTGIGAVILTGLADAVMTGGFHRTLLMYLDYNMHAGDRHGVMAWYVFIALYLGLALPPTFLSWYRGLDWKKTYRDLLPVVLYFGIFLAAHTLSPHKEDRFAIPMVPAFLMLLVPLLIYFRDQNGKRWRLWYFGGLNTILLVAVCLSVPQNNIVSLAQDLYRHPEIKSLASVGESATFFPHAFTGRILDIRTVQQPDLEAEARFDCSTWVVVRRDYRAQLTKILEKDFVHMGSYEPALPEKLVIRLNPQRNIRRSGLDAYSPRSCHELKPTTP